MVVIKSVDTRKGRVALFGSNIDANRVSVVTGPNGAGKTEILCAIADGARRDGYFPFGTDGVVSRLICQTFSPFSRFAGSQNGAEGVASSYRDGVEDLSFYVSLGITRDKSFRSSKVAVDVLERAILGVSQNEGRANQFFHFLTAVGFLERCEIKFSFYPEAIKFLRMMRLGKSVAFEFVRSMAGGRALSELRKQIAIDGWDELYEILDVSLATIGESMQERDVLVDFGRDAVGSSLSFARFQSLSVLRRLKLVKVSAVHVFRKSGESLSIVAASSGEQQFLCSMLGLAGTIRNDSVILIDEPELSLHPRWQIEYANNLLALLKLVQGCHVVIATHSPLIAQGFMLHGCEAMALRNQGVARSLAERSESVEGILVDVFDSPVPSSLYLADELMRVISLAEDSSQSKDAAIERLNSLSVTFGGSPEDAKYIEDAKRLVLTDE